MEEAAQHRKRDRKCHSPSPTPPPQTLRLRDINTREIIAETSSEKGHFFSKYERRDWVGQIIKEQEKNELR